MKAAVRERAVNRPLSVLVPTRRRPRIGYLIAALGHALLLAALLAVRDETTPLSKGFGLMAVVIAAAFIGGLGPGIFASTLGFLIFNFVFIPPYGSLAIEKAEDVVVLFVFLGLSVLISAILSLETQRREASESRERELEILNELSRDLVTNPPGPSSYHAALGHIVRLFGFAAGSLFTPGRNGTEALVEQATIGAPPGTITTGWNPEAGSAPLRIPLSAAGRNLGLLVLTGTAGPLVERESRVLNAFCNELALVLERDRLIAVAEEADVYRRTDQIRRSLLGAVSHELRSPLAAIKASVTDLLAPDAPQDSQYAREVLEAVNAETDRLDRLITNLLDMSRIDAGALLARVQASDLSEAASSCGRRLEGTWPQHRVRTAVPPDAQLVLADPVFLERVLTNLLENAAKASPPGWIDLEATRDGAEVVMRVIDHGPGIPAEVRDQVFQPFYALDRRNSRPGKGLGLAISRGFLDAMGGSIWIEDTPGGGATFAFRLPASDGRR